MSRYTANTGIEWCPEHAPKPCPPPQFDWQAPCEMARVERNEAVPDDVVALFAWLLEDHGHEYGACVRDTLAPESMAPALDEPETQQTSDDDSGAAQPSQEAPMLAGTMEDPADPEIAPETTTSKE